ncbi:MAG TPA: non-canonical purine NTP pyrophosphatase [Abditibacteriaceae bacterium]|jgi:XTP/dITP diphosphohydrolase
MKLLLATGNHHKVTEISDLLRDVPNLEIVSLNDFPHVEMPEETGSTMAENARIKALHCLHETGLPSLADDSGIEVDALDGAPGVHSARWVEGSDADRIAALLQKLSGTPAAERTARYRCTICIAFPDGRMIETQGTCEGHVAHQPRGEHGFGYDPVLEISDVTGAPSEYSGLTIAQIPPPIKAQISHRAGAVRDARDRLNDLLSQNNS